MTNRINEQLNTVVDAAARAAALDPTRSFCVSAPAGSGKTELLIQRYLCLLSRVTRPEQVLAITFTRKAAAEMRERVIAALHAARDNEPCDNPHHRVTRELANKALAADERSAWQLLRNISRFNIKTIDSFCAGLTRQMPVLSEFGGLAATQDDATPLYGEAVRELYKLLEEGHPIAADVAALMLHFDNNWERLQELLVAMLARREQWRGYVGVHHAPEESQAYLVAAVEGLVEDELGPLAAMLAPFAHQLLELQQFAATNMAMPFPAEFPASAASNLRAWRDIRQFLLTTEGQWRKSVTRKNGFPSDKGVAQQRKKQMQELLFELAQVEGLRARLDAIQKLPTIAQDSVSWQFVLHLSRLLPMLAAQLLLVFQKHGVTDHSQVAQAALQALGDDDAPTDLALRLDYRIEHILVDEFQDTAVTQYELLHKLTRGWGEHNTQHFKTPRTLMIVGDGMQSVYGFRGANVGLFLRARRNGFNGVQLQPLELQCNFRSDAGVVAWVNDTFARAFPAQSDVSPVQVGYSPATAVRPFGSARPVAMHSFSGEGAREQEVAFICEQIRSWTAAGGETIAVLGRSRGHLQPIIRRLKQLRIACNAPELDSLDQSPVIADLLILCRALANDADRLAWLALLRAPWCGLQLADLLTVASFGPLASCTSVWSILQHVDLRDALSSAGRDQLQQILPALQRARAKRDRLGLRVWIEQAWVGLGGPECVPTGEGLVDAENFLQLLEQAEAEGVGFDIDWLERRLQKQYMSAGDPESRVHLMTLHKAKGLEFDRVIIPQLDRPPRNDGREILLWDEHTNAAGERSFLLAADDHSPGGAPTLYNYLRSQRLSKSLLENTRLLYVGATRAACQLLLTARVRRDEKTGLPCAPTAQSLLSPIWQMFATHMTAHDPRRAIPAESVKPPAPPLRRLSRGTQHSIDASSESISSAAHAAPVRFDNHTQRSVGTVVHLAMQELSQLAVLPAEASDRQRQRWRIALQRAGVWGEALDSAVEAVLHCVSHTLRIGSPGRWILGAGHVDARSEWALSTVDALGHIRDIIIDRSFIDQATGERWLIDYKTSQPAPAESVEEFILRESTNYVEQLQRYREALRGLGNERVRCALFFTALGILHTVQALDLSALQEAIAK